MSPTRPARIAIARTAWLPVASAAALFVAAALTNSVWPQLLGCVVVGFLVTSFLAVARPLRIAVSVQMPDRVVAGQPFETAITLHNLSARAARALVVRHSWPTSRTLVAAHATFVDRIEPHGDVVMTTTRTPAARGVLTASEVRLVATAPFGFFSRTVVQPIAHELLVLPVLAPIEPIRARAADAGGAREWRSGDQVRNVQWRSTARTGRLTVIDRDHVATGPLVVLIAGRSGDPVLEEAISRAAMAGTVALRRGTVVLVAGDDGGCVRARTEGSLIELLARADVREPLNEAALNRAMRSASDGGSVVLATGRTVPGAWMPAVQRVAALAGVTILDQAVRA